MSKYPSPELQDRIAKYNLYEKIFLGEHFDAFKQLAPKEVSESYSRLRYVACSFGKMMSLLSADMLFEEFPKISLQGGDTNFFNSMMQANKFQIQLYESGAEQSYFGDVVLRMRAKEGRLILEDIQPHSYDVEINPMNVRAEPSAHILQWVVDLPIAGGKQRKALFKEIHRKGKIEYKLIEILDGELSIELPIGDYFKDEKGNPHPEVVDTKVDDFLIVHIPNYRTNTRYFGISDYKDLINMFYAINNRITRVDNILDAHGEPILAVPNGVLDDKGGVRREAFGVIEVDNMEAGGQMPQYIVWDAKLESAFEEIDRLVDYMFMFSEMSPALFGRDKDGQAESGRALKYRLLRTLAKKHRKELYYDANLRSFLTTAQKFAKANGLSCNNAKMTGKVVEPTIKWQDGVINDALEQIEVEERKLDAGLTTKAESIAVVDGITEEEAEEKLQKIKKEAKENQPTFTANPIFGNTNGKNSDSSDANKDDQQ